MMERCASETSRGCRSLTARTSSFDQICGGTKGADGQSKSWGRLRARDRFTTYEVPQLLVLVPKEDERAGRLVVELAAGKQTK